MPRLLGLCSVLIASLLAVTPARADVSWDFIVTSAVNLGCSTCALPPLPEWGATLTVPDAAFLRGSLSYSYYVTYSEGGDNVDGHLIGDTDFELYMGDLTLPVTIFDDDELGWGATVDLWFSRNGKLSAHIEGWTYSDYVFMDIENNVVTNSYWASDGDIPGCGEFTQCSVSGYWKLTSGHPLPHRVPEPSALSLLVGAIAILGVLRRRVVLLRSPLLRSRCRLPDAFLPRLRIA